ncbi:MAG: hypothetical protein HUU55_01385 [Myxococcales bacterium]|nr:hypothetical protein [Myxococcales bacterium]
MMFESHRRGFLWSFFVVPAILLWTYHPLLASQPSLLHSFPPTLAPIDLTVSGNQVYFLGFDPVHQYEIWRTDGTSAGTYMVSDNAPNQTLNAYLPQFWDNFDVLFGHHGKVFVSIYTLSAGYEPWVTDGTPEGTVMLKDIYPGYSDSLPQLFTAYLDRVYFIAGNATGYQLYETDGTSEGTVPVVALPTPPANPPWCMVSTGSNLFFDADSSVFGRELWVSDGTWTGTHLVEDIVPGVADSNPCDFAGINNTLYFSATMPMANKISPKTSFGLWTSDGTFWGTQTISKMPVTKAGMAPKGFVYHGGKIYFSAESQTGRELWKTNGTQAGTTLVKDIFPGSSSSNPGGKLTAQSAPKPCRNYDSPSEDSEFLSFGGKLYFAATDPARGTELFVTDGTSSGTVLLKDIFPGSPGSDPRSFVAAGDFVYFVADTPKLGSALFRTDGTAAGTIQMSTSLMVTDHMEVLLNQLLMVATCTNSDCGDPGTVGLWAFCIGCSIDGDCVFPGAINPTSPCEVCDPLLQSSTWSPAGSDQWCVLETPCSIQFGQCGAGQCVAVTSPMGDCPFEVTSCSPSAAEPGSYRTVVVTGTGFSPATKLTLSKGVVFLQNFLDPTQIVLEVQVPMEPGSYALTATPPGNGEELVSILQNAITVVDTFKPGLGGGSCITDIDCIEGDPCTQDQCYNNGCVSSLRPECCLDPGACNICDNGFDLTGDGLSSGDDIQCGILATAWLAGKKGEPYPGCMATPLATVDADCDGAVNLLDLIVLIESVLDGELGPLDANGNGCVDTCEW